MKSFLTLSILLIISVFLSCKKDSFITGSDARISFSQDTLHFDTLFTTAGSITQSVKIINNNNQKLLLSDVKLVGGTVSAFRINIDGAAVTEASNIELEANDSLYVFVSVHIDQSSTNLPFVMQDSIQVSYNGNTRFIQLDAFGQNAHFLRTVKLTGNNTWTNDRPYVILGGLLIDTTATLTIQQGCRIYFHADAPLIVDGTLLVGGDKYDSTRVYFSGDRLDDPYKNFPASWPGIYFRGKSKDNLLQYATVKNAYQGIVAEERTINSNPKVSLKECIIDNIYDAGIFGAQSDIDAENCLVSNCGKNIVISYGGKYNFTHCTVASISNDYIIHQNPVLNVSNFSSPGSGITTDDLTCSFINCIFWGLNGTVDNEVAFSKQDNTGFNVDFKNCLWKLKDSPPAYITSSGMILNQDPLFDSLNTQKRLYDYHLKPGSPAINAGIPTSIPVDLDGKPRTMGLAPDLGSYETD